MVWTKNNNKNRITMKFQYFWKMFVVLLKKKKQYEILSILTFWKLFMIKNKKSISTSLNKIIFGSKHSIKSY